MCGEGPKKAPKKQKKVESIYKFKSGISDFKKSTFLLNVLLLHTYNSRNTLIPQTSVIIPQITSAAKYQREQTLRAAHVSSAAVRSRPFRKVLCPKSQGKSSEGHFNCNPLQNGLQRSPLSNTNRF